MTGKRNGVKVPAVEAVDKLAKLKPGGGLPAEAAAYLEARTEHFQKGTQGKGKPQIYGGKRS